MTNQNQSVESMSLEEFIRRAIEEAQRSDVFIRTCLNHRNTEWLFPRPVGKYRGMLIDDPTLIPTGIDGVFATGCKFRQQSISIEFLYLRYRTDDEIERLIEAEKSYGNSDDRLQLISESKSVECSFSKTIPLRKPVW